MHGLLDDEVQAIIALYHESSEIDRSHRMLALRGSYTNTAWFAPSSVGRVLAVNGLFLHPPKRPGASVRNPFPEWVEYRPNQIWIYDIEHFTRARAAVTVVEDLVSSQWLAHIVSSEETSTQVDTVFTDVLAAQEGCSQPSSAAKVAEWTSRSTIPAGRSCSPSRTTAPR